MFLNLFRLPTFLVCFSYFFGFSLGHASPVKKKEWNNTTLHYYDSLDTQINSFRHVIDKINIGAINPKFNGSVLVGYQGRILYAKSYGLANREENIPNELSMPTQLASISKTFTGTAMAWLAEKKLLQLDDYVQLYLPELPYPELRLKDLLSHRSGLPEYLDFSRDFWHTATPMNNEDVLRQLIDNQLELEFIPDHKFSYCNSNFALLALVIERVTHMKYARFMERYFFEPAGMTDTFVYEPENAYSCRIAHSYRANFSDWQNNYQDGVYGDKGIFSSPEDLYRWDQFLYSNALLSEETKETLFSPTNGDAFKNYGLGWRMFLYPSGQKVIYHTGWWHGYQGILSRYVKDDFTVIITSNRYIKGIAKNAFKIREAAQDYLCLTDLYS